MLSITISANIQATLLVLSILFLLSSIIRLLLIISYKNNMINNVMYEKIFIKSIYILDLFSSIILLFIFIILTKELISKYL